jgi:hypothetical protein
MVNGVERRSRGNVTLDLRVQVGLGGCPAESTSTPSHGARKAAVAPKPEGLAGRSPKRPTMKGMGDTKMGKVQEGDAKMKEGIAL